MTVPIRLGFDLPNDAPEWVYSDWIVDAFFLVDILVNFRTCYFDDRHVLITTGREIVQRYLRTWFIIDVLSTIPIDKLMGPAGSNSRSLKLIRVIRLVRLFKLLKLLKMQSSQGNDELVTINPVVLKISKLLITLVFIAHFFGCFFAYLTLLHVNDDGDEGGRAGFEREDYLSWWKSDGEVSDFVDNKSKVYLSAIYWAFTTMTTVGYGERPKRASLVTKRVLETNPLLLSCFVKNAPRFARRRGHPAADGQREDLRHSDYDFGCDDIWLHSGECWQVREKESANFSSKTQTNPTQPNPIRAASRATHTGSPRESGTGTQCSAITWRSRT